jgi:cytidine deaminase
MTRAPESHRSPLEFVITDAARERARGIDFEDLYARAGQARENAHAPYSRFNVGAALLTDAGEIITGCNMENASYGLTICAERLAVGRAVSEGHRHFRALAIAVDGDAGTGASCGACLQVLAEFSPDGALIVAYPEEALLRVACLSDLLPVRFSL